VTGSSRASGYLYVVLAAACFGVNGSVSKLVLQAGLEPERLTALRCTGAAAGLIAWMLLSRRERIHVRARELPALVACGIAGAALVQWLYFVAIGRLPVGVALLLEFTAPVFVALWARFVRRHPVRPRLWAALVLTVAGLAGVAQVGGAGLDPVGVAAGFGAALALAAFYLLGEHTMDQRSGLELSCLVFVVAALFWAVVQPFWTFPVGTLAASTPGGPVWLLCCFVVVAGTIAPYLLNFAALARLPATAVSITGTSEPVLAGLVAWLALGEALGPLQLLGGAVVLLGIVLAQTATPAVVPTPVSTADDRDPVVR
jgi:drug/metabolite transporter (DMT)-like permease